MLTRPASGTAPEQRWQQSVQIDISLGFNGDLGEVLPPPMPPVLGFYGTWVVPDLGIPNPLPRTTLLTSTCITTRWYYQLSDRRVVLYREASAQSNLVDVLLYC